ncbi:MAG: polysaccharide deacetylase family protein [Chloroflexaceae bacterium]|nr:polysaccharide deacetylase family protein [Chloroflexaceae bacterium]
MMPPPIILRPTDPSNRPTNPSSERPRSGAALAWGFVFLSLLILLGVLLMPDADEPAHHQRRLTVTPTGHGSGVAAKEEAPAPVGLAPLLPPSPSPSPTDRMPPSAVGKRLQSGPAPSIPQPRITPQTHAWLITSTRRLFAAATAVSHRQERERESPLPTTTPTPTPTSSLPTPTPTSTSSLPTPVPLSAPVPMLEQLPSIGYPSVVPAASAILAAPAASAAVAPSTPAPAGTVVQVGSIPVLMYHYIREVDPVSDPLGWRLSIPPEPFAAQLDWLSREHYVTLRMDTVVACLEGELLCPPRSVALTFDDGYADAYTEALPRLLERGFVATFYLVNRYIGQEGYMGWDEIRALRDAGMEIGAHTLNHLDLTTLGSTQASHEIAASRTHLATTLQVPVESFCYPVGRYTEETRDLVEQAGYRSAVTTMPGWYQGDRYTLPRIRVDGGSTQEGFEALVRQYTQEPPSDK